MTLNLADMPTEPGSSALLVDDRFMTMALRAATLSPDPSTQNGAVILGRDGQASAPACNAWPPGVTGTWEPAKYDYIEHAERAAVYRAAADGISTHRGRMYCGWAACSDCARAIVMAGIVELIRLPFLEDDIAQGSRWGESCRVGDDIMRQAGVVIREMRLSAPVGVTLRRDGKALVF